MTILISIVVLGIIILVHELGHFLTARAFKMPISEFSIGMGPQVYSVETDRTLYSFRAIPLGGYVNIEGMEMDAEIENGFASKPAYQRLIVLSAGVFFNFVLAFLLLVGLHFHMGDTRIQEDAVIGKVIEGSPAAKYLQAGDRIVQIEGQPILEWTEIHTMIANKKEIQISIERGEEEKSFQIPLLQEAGNSYLGIYPELLHKDLNFVESVSKARESFVGIITDMLGGLHKMVTGKVSMKEISGPIGILQVVGEASKQGFLSLLWLSVFLSINVGLLNLLPLPALDGGRILFVFLEFLHIPMNKRIEERIHKIGLALFLAFIFFISIQDIFNLF